MMELKRNHDGDWGVSVPDRRVNGLPGFLRIQNIVSIINNIYKTNHLISKPNKLRVCLNLNQIKHYEA